MLTCRQTIILFCFMILFSGCASAAKDQPVPLSEAFELKRVSGGMGIWKWKRNDIYVRGENNKLKYIGTVEVDAPNILQSFGAGGLEHRVLAISKDGRSIIFDHWAFRAPSKSRLESGMYSFRTGDKPRRIFSEKPMNTAMWKTWPKPLPKNLIPFHYFPSTYTPDDMMWAIRADDEKIFSLALLDANPVHQCAFDGDISTCKKILKQGANIDAETYWGFTPLDLAIIRGHEDTAIYLLIRGANPNRGIYPAFHYAVMLGRMNVVKAMLEQGVDANKKDQCKNTLYQVALNAGEKLCSFSEIHTFFEGTLSPRSLADKKVTPQLLHLLQKHSADSGIE